MKEFTTVALPWVLAGIAIALICASFSKTKRTKKQEEWEKERKLETCMAVGMLIGLLAGVAVSKLDLFENGGIAYALGSLWGMAIAAVTGDMGKKIKKSKIYFVYMLTY